MIFPFKKEKRSYDTSYRRVYLFAQKKKKKGYIYGERKIKHYGIGVAKASLLH